MNITLLGRAALVLAAALPASAYAQTVVYNGGGLAIRDLESTVSTITVAPPVAGRTISNVALTLNNLQHTYSGDITSYLSFSGVQSVLLNRTGAATDFSGNYSFADNSPNGTFASQSSTPGTFSPFSPLSAFNGRSAAGDWSLLINDGEFDDEGSLGSWSLAITYAAAAPEPGTWLLMILGFGLAGTALRARPRRIAFGSAVTA